MTTSEPGPFTDRGDRAEAAAFRGDGAYSGGDFAGDDPERYDRLSGADQNAEPPATDQGSDSGRDVESRDPQHP